MTARSPSRQVPIRYEIGLAAYEAASDSARRLVRGELVDGPKAVAEVHTCSRPRRKSDKSGGDARRVSTQAKSTGGLSAHGLVELFFNY